MEGPRILIVDDDISSRNLIKLILSDFKTELAANGKEALDKITQSPFDLVLADIKMPQMTGIELVEAMRARNCNNPVILVTGNIESNELKGHPVFHTISCLEKPFEDIDLVKLVERLLKRKK